jgi:hypothetical protein
MPYSERGSGEGSGTRPPSESSESRRRSAEASAARTRDELSMRERTDLAEVAMQRAVELRLHELRDETNERVRVSVLEAELAHTRKLLTASTTTIARVDRRRIPVWSAVASLVVAICGLVVERITSDKVDERAEHAAETVVEERAQPIEERATAAGTVSTETVGRQAELEAREAARDARMDRIEASLERLTAEGKSRKGNR